MAYRSDTAVGCSPSARVRRLLAVSLFPLLVLPAFQPWKARAQSRDGDQPATTVSVDKVRREALHQTAPVIGRLVARESGPVATRIAGPVAAMRARVGDRVKEGDVIAVLDKDTLQWQHELQRAEVAKQEAVVRTRKAEIALISQEVKRLEGLKRSAAFSQARYEDRVQEQATARSRLGEAEAELLRARANEKLAAINLDNADIRAPYDGVVSALIAEVGGYLGVGQPVVMMINDTRLEVEADVPAERLAALAPGTAVKVRIEGHENGATVRAIVPDENPATRTRQVRFTLTEAAEPGVRAANQSVVLDIPAAAAREAVTVHKDAILYRQGNTLVFVVRDGKAEICPVRLGEAVGNRFAVASGVAPGDLVVVRGNERLRPGQLVTAREGT